MADVSFLQKYTLMFSLRTIDFVSPPYPLYSSKISNARKTLCNVTRRNTQIQMFRHGRFLPFDFMWIEVFLISMEIFKIKKKSTPSIYINCFSKISV